MPLRVDFRKPIDGGGGRIDLMRVLASNSQIADDFDPNVIFSSNWPSARAEVFTATVDNFTNFTVEGSFTLARPYKTHPVVFPSFIRTTGEIYFPYFYMQKHIRNNGQSNGTVITTLERLDLLQVDVVSTGGNNYKIEYKVINFGVGNKLGPGTLFVRACGQGV